MCGTDCGWMEVRSFLAQERRRCACACDAELHEWGVARHGEGRERERERDLECATCSIISVLTQWGATL